MSTTQANRLMSITTPLGDDFLLINKLSANEALSELFRFDVELLHAEDEAGSEPTIVDPKKILGQPVTITVTIDDVVRIFNGMVNSFSQGNRDERFSYYYATIVPHVWLLTKRSQSRIFQHKNVPDILKEVFKGVDVAYEIQGTFEPRNYCVQYRETDFAFASRLMEEEGIFYYFKHADKKHQMVLANTPQSNADCPNKSEVPFFLDVSGNEKLTGSIATWQVDYKIQSGKVTLWDSHFELPGKQLDAEKNARQDSNPNAALEVYDYPGTYAKKFDGIDRGGAEQPASINKIFTENKKTAGIRMEEIDAQYKTVSGISDCCSLTSGHRFKLTEHPNNDFNILHTLISVSHEVAQSPDYVSDDEVPGAYGNSFKCMPNIIPFRPIQVTPKPSLQGSQTAFVVGPPGEEIFTDKYGRVKVQFHWDREGQSDANSSCWIRVVQSWAGNTWGSMFIPRIGMEVRVEFLEGDPDQPIITGCVYNAGAMPPYKLPAEKTKMSIKSDSSPGGGGFNEIRFEDKKGSEQIFMHGEKDMDVRIKNDRRELIGRDDHLIVKRDERERVMRDIHRIVERDVVEEIKRDSHQKVTGKTATEIGQSVSNKVGTNMAEEIGGNYSSKVTGNYSIKAKQIVLEAEAGLTINVGGNFVTILPAGVFIKGTMVFINSGGSALPGVPGQLVPPMAVAEAEIADNADPGSKAPSYKHQRQQQTPMQALKFNSPSHKPNASQSNSSQSGSSAEDNEKKKTWIEIKLVDQDGNPVPGEEYIVKLPDGQTVATGTLDENGFARVDNIDPGNCEVIFPNLDARIWNKK